MQCLAVMSAQEGELLMVRFVFCITSSSKTHAALQHY
jgi:hypothetical protein